MLGTNALGRAAIVRDVAADIVSTPGWRRRRRRRVWSRPLSGLAAGEERVRRTATQRRSADSVDDLVSWQRARAVLRSETLECAAIVPKIAADVVAAFAIRRDYRVVWCRGCTHVARSVAKPYLDAAKADTVKVRLVHADLAHLCALRNAHGGPIDALGRRSDGGRIETAVCHQICCAARTLPRGAADCAEHDFLTPSGRLHWWRWRRRWR